MAHLNELIFRNSRNFLQFSRLYKQVYTLNNNYLRNSSLYSKSSAPKFQCSCKRVLSISSPCGTTSPSDSKDSSQLNPITDTGKTKQKFIRANLPLVFVCPHIIRKRAGDSATTLSSEPLCTNPFTVSELQGIRPHSMRRVSLLSSYMKLSKFRLSALVTMTAIGGFWMAPAASALGPELATLAYCALGTMLTASAANTVNQLLEVHFDAQMARTKSRPLVRGFSRTHAICFALTSLIAGSGVLCVGCNPVASTLAVINFVLYTSVYTPLKRESLWNTWIGAVVGAIPPLIGWTAATGGSLELGAWVLAYLLFAWQMPHFLALSWGQRGDYAKAGYRMAASERPALCKASALRHSLGLAALSAVAPAAGLTSLAFLPLSAIPNAYLVRLALAFAREPTPGADEPPRATPASRALFHYSLVYLPIILSLLLLTKNQQSHPHTNTVQLQSDSRKPLSQ